MPEARAGGDVRDRVAVEIGVKAVTGVEDGVGGDVEDEVAAFLQFQFPTDTSP